MTRHKLLTILQACIISSALILAWSPIALAAFNASDLIDDSDFDNTSTMTGAQIDSFINGFSSSCISTNAGFRAPQPTGYTPSGGFTYGSDVSAGTIIYDAGQVYGVNPEVILTTLQKEQSLVSGGSGCSTLQYIGAMGNDCPDGGTSYNYSGFELYSLHGTAVKSVRGTCVDNSKSAGFARQVITATWKLAFFRQRAEGKVSWDAQKTNFPNSGNIWNNSDDPGTCYNGYMTAGNRARSDGTNSTCSPLVTYGGIYTIDGTRVTMDNGATAGLYYYTPHLSGNQHFDTIYSGWFGSPTSPCMATTNLVSPVTGGHKVITFKNNNSGPSNLVYFEMNDTGSACTELHIMNPGDQSWAEHVTSAMKASDPSKQIVVPMKIAGSQQDTLLDIMYASGGRVQIHKMSPDLQTFPGYYDVLTNLTGVDASTGTFIAGDFLGRGYDQLAYVKYGDSNGDVEIHLFDPTLRAGVGYYDVVTNLKTATPTSGVFIAGDFLGRGYDQLAYIAYGGSTGDVEVHLFDKSLKQGNGFYDVPVKDLPAISASTGTFVAGDFLGRGYDQLAYIRYVGSGGHVESHLFSRDLRQAVGVQDQITVLDSFSPN